MKTGVFVLLFSFSGLIIMCILVDNCEDALVLRELSFMMPVRKRRGCTCGVMEHFPFHLSSAIKQQQNTD